MKIDPYCQRIYCMDYIDIAGRSSAKGVKQVWGGEKSYFLAKYVHISQTVGDRSKVTIDH